MKMTLSLKGFENFFRYYRGHDWQRSGIESLYESLRVEFPDLLHENSAWVDAYRGEADTILLDVPYEYQLDNGPTGFRECFSSSMAMIAKFAGAEIKDDCEYLEKLKRFGDTTDPYAHVHLLKFLGIKARFRQDATPKEIKDDCEYLEKLKRFGDTTDPYAHVHLLKFLGIKARFRQDATPKDIEDQLRGNKPVAVGWLHKGKIDSPHGGGHWSVICGCTPDNWIHADPNGEADMLNGGYVNHTHGDCIKYSRKNWERRWLVDGPATGWMICLESRSEA